MSDYNELEILKQISVINRDNGIVFTDTTRLDVIAKLLESSAYQKLNDCGLFHLYSKHPLNELSDNVLLVSSHVDCEANISRCFTEVKEDDILLGTFDNMLTNAAVLTVMLRNELPDNVVIAFTGDEEEDGVGAIQASRFLENHKKTFYAIVLDVSDVGFGKVDFTVENGCWEKPLGRAVINTVKSISDRWLFVPSDVDEIPSYIPGSKIVYKDADDDESSTYDDKDIQCFSLCIPTAGEMHCDAGILSTVSSFKAYIKALVTIVDAVSRLV